MFDQKLLANLGECPYTGFEKLCKRDMIFHRFTPEVAIYESNSEKTIRLLYRDPETKKFTSGLLLNRLHNSRVYDIQGVYTLPEHRCKGYAKGLLAVAKICFKDVRHSPYLTDLGEKFAKIS